MCGRILDENLTKQSCVYLTDHGPYLLSATPARIQLLESPECFYFTETVIKIHNMRHGSSHCHFAACNFMFSPLTHCENSVCASKATERGKMGACSLYSIMNENSSSEIFLYINSLVAETLPHFFISILSKLFIQRQSI